MSVNENAVCNKNKINLKVSPSLRALIQRRDAALAQEALSWIVRARRPLKAVELQQAVAFEVDVMITRLDQEELLAVDEIVSLCAGLITEGERSGSIRLVHFTTQKFLGHNWMQWIPDAETTIALKCIRYLSSDSFSNG